MQRTFVEQVPGLTIRYGRMSVLLHAHRHVAEFAAMMRDLSGEHLGDWMQAVQADDPPALHSLIAGPRRDQLAVTNGLTLPWSSGPAEGAVNRIKALKRAMLGRANLDQLRRRILLPN